MKRPETGVMQFGDDWPGIFIRGDRALALAIYLEAALKNLEAGGAHGAPIRYGRSLMDLLRSCDARKNPEPQRALVME